LISALRLLLRLLLLTVVLYLRALQNSGHCNSELSMNNAVSYFCFLSGDKASLDS
jgi:hypothetical protein